MWCTFTEKRIIYGLICM